MVQRARVVEPPTRQKPGHRSRRRPGNTCHCPSRGTGTSPSLPVSHAVPAPTAGPEGVLLGRDGGGQTLEEAELTRGLRVLVPSSRTRTSKHLQGLRHKGLLSKGETSPVL